MLESLVGVVLALAVVGVLAWKVGFKRPGH